MDWFCSYAERVMAWARAHPALYVVILGLITACGYPPFHAWWAALPALALLIAHLHKTTSWRAAAWQGWLFGWAHLTLANNWIATAFTYQTSMPGFLGWVAVPLLCVYLAVYPAIAVAIAHFLARRLSMLAFGSVLAGTWIVTEWLRSWVFTGYPWPPLGLILLGDWGNPGVAGVLPWMGTYALSGLAILIATIFASGIAMRRFNIALGTAAIVCAAMLIPFAAPSKMSNVSYTLVQPLITQDEINDPTRFEEQFARIADLTSAGRGQSRLVLWPESAVPDYLEDGYPQRYYDQLTARNPLTGRGDPEFARRRIAAAIGPDATLLTGAINLDFRETAGIKTVQSARNSVLAINGEGEITGHYAKAHLVPYGEYLPMRDLLGPLGFSRLVAGTIDYREGPGPSTLDLGNMGRAGLQICYEIVFSGQVVDQSDRPDYIFNPSNDGWFGWWGSPQFVGQSRMRAIEEGLPVLRSTTTGISAVIDANGVVLDSLPSGAAGAISGVIPAAKSPTLFARFGNKLPLMWAALLLLLGLVLPRLLALRSTSR